MMYKFLLIFICVWGATLAHPTTTESLVLDTSTNSLAKESSYKESGEPKESFDKVPKITELRIFTNISNRFAHTIVRSKVKNFANTSVETTFSIVLPDSAYISGFVMEVGGKNYTAYVKEKEEAKKTYDEAVARGFGAAHVTVDARDSNVFTVSVNVEPESKAIFYLTYEELLKRQDGHYELIINIHPGQPVKDLGVEVKIVESRPLTGVKAPPLRSGNEIGSDKEELDPRANIEIVNSTSAVITFTPTIQRQKELAKYLGTKEDEGLAGQFVVQYDVERDPSGGEVLLDDGYFVHFFAPSDLTPLPKHVLFVLDTSGSMYGRKITQLREAMYSILQELKNTDKFNLIEFNSNVKVWNLESPSASAVYPLDGMFSWDYEAPDASLDEVQFPPAYPVTPENIERAKSAVSTFINSGGTDAYDALRVALHLVEREKRNKDSDQLQSLIVFLTDGQPNRSPSLIDKKITEFNTGPRKSALFALSFGEGADKQFLQKLALHNSGFSKHIYEGADASLQLQDFYKQISSPLLANVTFKYSPTVTGVTKTEFPMLFGGSELVVAGQYGLDTAADENKQTDIVLPVTGRSTTGIINLRPVAARSVTGLQRLWAYLTIKQLLEEKEISKNPEDIEKKAIDLALEHSFVTPVSSLVVVKPNETRAVNAESTAQRKGLGYRGGPSSFQNPLTAPGSFQSPISAPVSGLSYQPTIAAYGQNSYVARRGGSGFARPVSAPVQHWFLSFGSSGFSAPGVPENAVASYASYGSNYETSTEAVQSTSTNITAVTDKAEETTVLDKMPWLRNITNENHTIKLPVGEFDLGLNATVPGVPGCTNSPTNATATCTLLKDCSEATNFLLSFSDLVQYFCPLDRYVGVCCPSIDTASI